MGADLIRGRAVHKRVLGVEIGQQSWGITRPKEAWGLEPVGAAGGPPGNLEPWEKMEGTKDQTHVSKRVRSDCRDRRTRVEMLVMWARLHVMKMDLRPLSRRPDEG